MTDTSSQRTQTAVLGLGALGSALAGALLAASHSTTVWNRTSGRAADLTTRGATSAASVEAAIGAADVVVIALADQNAVRSVLEPVAGTLADRVLVNLTSGTPEQARDLAEWAARYGAEHLDAAAMSGVRLIGRQEALFLYSGSAAAFATAKGVLGSFGRATFLGSDHGLASLYDTALLGVNMSVLSGFYHALALVGSAGVAAIDFAAVAADYLPFTVGLFTEHARQAEQGRYLADEGTLEVLAAAVDHLVVTSVQAGIGTDIPDGVRALIERGIAAGHGHDGPASLVEAIRVDR